MKEREGGSEKITKYDKEGGGCNEILRLIIFKAKKTPAETLMSFLKFNQFIPVFKDNYEIIPI